MGTPAGGQSSIGSPMLTSGNSNSYFGELQDNPYNLFSYTGGSVGKFLGGQGTPADPNPASTELANIANENWAQYQQNYYPVENALTNMIGNSGYNQQQVGLNVSSYNQASAAANTGFQQNLGRMGVQMTGAQSSAYNRYKNINDTLGQTQAANSSNIGLQSMETSAIGGGSPPAVLGQINSGAAK